MVYNTPPPLVSWEHFSYPLHHAEHSDLNGPQKLAAQYYAECIGSLLRRRDAYRDTVASIPMSSFGRYRAPSKNQQLLIWDATQAYFDQLYTSLNALAGVQSRTRQVWAPNIPPTRSIEKYITWWQDGPEFLHMKEASRALAEARDYRTVTVHSQSKVVFDWKTHDYGPPTHAVGVALFGTLHPNASPPEGSTLSRQDPQVWEFPAPPLDDSTRAMLILSGAVFHSLAGNLPAPDDRACSWDH